MAKPHILRSFATAFDHMSPQERAMLRARFCDPLMLKFLDAQIAEALSQVTTLDPEQFVTDNAIEFLQAAKQARSVWQFWVEFRNFVADWAKPTSA